MEHPDLFKLFEEPKTASKAPRRPDLQPREWKVTALRECPVPESMMKMEYAEDGVRYWETHIAKGDHYNPDCESTAVLILNTRLRIRGHYLVSMGALNQTVAEPREVFRIAVMAAAHCVVLMHNHPSGEPDPSGADRRITSVLRSAGSILRIELIDHIITGGGGRYYSFREAGLLG